jgi:hypothetical protein
LNWRIAWQFNTARRSGHRGWNRQPLEGAIVVQAEPLWSRGNVVRAAFRGLRCAIRYGPVSLRSIDR